MNPWLERALVSAVASVISTSVWVRTAEKPKRKRRRRKKRKMQGDERERRQRPPEQRRNVSLGARAAREHQAGRNGGITPGEFVENVKGLGGSTARRARTVGRWLGILDAPPPSARETRSAGGSPPSPAGSEPARSRSREGARPPAGAGESLGEEALRRLKKAATDRVVQEVKEKTGLHKPLAQAKQVGDDVKQAGARVGQRLKEALPEDLGESLDEAGKHMREATGRATEGIKQVIEKQDAAGLADKLDRGVRDLGAWMQGPGAPRRPPAGADPGTSSGAAEEIVEAKEGRVQEPRWRAGQRHSDPRSSRPPSPEPETAPSAAQADEPTQAPTTVSGGEAPLPEQGAPTDEAEGSR